VAAESIPGQHVLNAAIPPRTAGAHITVDITALDLATITIRSTGMTSELVLSGEHLAALQKALNRAVAQAKRDAARGRMRAAA